MLAKHTIKANHVLVKKIMNMLRPIKDSLGLNVPGIYRILSEHSKVYIRQTGRTEKPDRRNTLYLYPGQMEKSAVADHSIKFISTSRLDKAAGYMDHVVKEAIQIHYHPTTATRMGASR